MELEIKGTPKEIADFVKQLQSQLKESTKVKSLENTGFISYLSKANPQSSHNVGVRNSNNVGIYPTPK